MRIIGMLMIHRVWLAVILGALVSFEKNLSPFLSLKQHTGNGNGNIFGQFKIDFTVIEILLVP